VLEIDAVEAQRNRHATHEGRVVLADQEHGRINPFCSRHGRACPGHPRACFPRNKAWMPGSSPGMTTEANITDF
jgi:hypothetical protein